MYVYKTHLCNFYKKSHSVFTSPNNIVVTAKVCKSFLSFLIIFQMTFISIGFFLRVELSQGKTYTKQEFSFGF